MGYLFGTEENNIILNIHTVFVILLVIVICIVIRKTFPKLIRTRKSRNTGMIGKRTDKSFAKLESKIDSKKTRRRN